MPPAFVRDFNERIASHVLDTCCELEKKKEKKGPGGGDWNSAVEQETDLRESHA